MKEVQAMDDHNIQVFMPMTSIRSGVSEEIATDVCCYTNQIVNIVMVGTEDSWVLVDTGMPGAAKKIIEAAEERFGIGARPQSIILTHGHFDHVGAAVELIKEWGVLSMHILLNCLF